jgi:hypothetical protein
MIYGIFIASDNEAYVTSKREFSGYKGFGAARASSWFVELSFSAVIPSAYSIAFRSSTSKVALLAPTV